MRVSAKLTSLAMGAAVVLGLAGTAIAAPAVANGTVNVRSGPGTGYQRVDTLFRGEQVNVRECQGTWCYITKSGPDGWVSANYLQRGRVQQQTIRPSVNFSFSFGNVQRPRHQGGNHHGNDHHDGGWNENDGWNNHDDWN